MQTMRLCKRCGAPLPADAPEGLCPKCLLRQGLGGQSGAGSDGATTVSSQPAGPAPPPPSEIAKHFPQLEILELLGQGGMGVVYKARQLQLDRFVALKILPADSAGAPAFAERFAREARALAKLNHPGIVAIYDFGQAGPYYYFVMEYVEGMNLRQLEQNHRLTPQKALSIVPKICEALQYAHDEGIVHRDIKPGNILVDKKGRVKIADFGLAKLMGRAGTDYTLTASQQVMGTPHYMAPEQMERPGEVDHRADIYSLGVVFYEMLTGELPLGRFAPPSQKVEVDVRLDEVVLKALENKPAQRYQRANEVKTDVETIAGGGAAGPVASAGRGRSEEEGSRCAVLRKVQPLGEVLLLVAGCAWFVALGVGSWLWWTQGNAAFVKGSELRTTLAQMSIGLGIYGLFILATGWSIRRLESRLFCLLAASLVGVLFPAIVALNVIMEFGRIPTWPVVIPLWLGMPVAAWAVSVLLQADVCAAFAQVRESGCPPKRRLPVGETRPGTLRGAWIKSRAEWVTLLSVGTVLLAGLAFSTAKIAKEYGPAAYSMSASHLTPLNINETNAHWIGASTSGSGWTWTQKHAPPNHKELELVGLPRQNLAYTLHKGEGPDGAISNPGIGSPLHITLPTFAYSYRTADGHEIRGKSGLTEQVILDWMKTVGIDTNAPGSGLRAGELLDVASHAYRLDLAEVMRTCGFVQLFGSSEYPTYQTPTWLEPSIYATFAALWLVGCAVLRRRVAVPTGKNSSTAVGWR